MSILVSELRVLQTGKRAMSMRSLIAVAAALLMAAGGQGQQLKVAQEDRSTPVHFVTFSLEHHRLTPATMTLKAGTYQIRFRNAEAAQDLNFDVAGKGKSADAHDAVTVSHSRSMLGYGLYRLTPGTYVLTVREYPQYQATIDVQPQ